MNIKEAAWNLGLIADCNILGANAREAARIAANAIVSVRNSLGLDATASVEDIERKVYELTQDKHSN